MLEKNLASTAPAADGSAQPPAATPATDPRLVAPGSADSAVARGERPRVAARAAEASQALSEAASARVAFTATTTDHLGFLGRAEGLLAIATALVYPTSTMRQL